MGASASTACTNPVERCRGGKGQGKSFQTELAMKKLGIEPVIMSAGKCPSFCLTCPWYHLSPDHIPGGIGRGLAEERQCL